jgi:hypothetical protein
MILRALFVILGQFFAENVIILKSRK